MRVGVGEPTASEVARCGGIREAHADRARLSIGSHRRPAGVGVERDAISRHERDRPRPLARLVRSESHAVDVAARSAEPVSVEVPRHGQRHARRRLEGHHQSVVGKRVGRRVGLGRPRSGEVHAERLPHSLFDDAADVGVRHHVGHPVAHSGIDCAIDCAVVSPRVGGARVVPTACEGQEGEEWEAELGHRDSHFDWGRSRILRCVTAPSG